MVENMNEIKAEEGDICFTARGVIKISCIMAYREFERKPRKKAMKFLNLLMTLIKQNGMKTDKHFKDFIDITRIDSKGLDAFIEEIMAHVTDMQVFNLLQYLKD